MHLNRGDFDRDNTNTVGTTVGDVDKEGKISITFAIRKNYGAQETDQIPGYRYI